MTKEEALLQMRRTSAWRTICEVHREIYDASEDAKVRDLVLEAFVMGKKMEKKLREYKTDWDAGMWETNEDHGQDTEFRSR